MRILALFICFLFCVGEIFSQDLEGEWEGTFTDDRNYIGSYQTKIIFLFIKKTDSTFEAFSKTFIKDDEKIDSAICVLRGGFLEKNILYLEEIRSIKSFSTNDTNTCLQLMKLYYTEKKKQLILHGKWYTEKNNCGFGGIRLTKKLK